MELDLVTSTVARYGLMQPVLKSISGYGNDVGWGGFHGVSWLLIRRKTVFLLLESTAMYRFIM